MGSVLVLMLGLVIGTALLAPVEHTTLLAAQAASSVEHSRMTHLPVAMTLISLAHEALVLGVAAEAAAAVVLDLDGNLVTGFAAGDFEYFVHITSIFSYMIYIFLLIFTFKNVENQYSCLFFTLKNK